MTYDGHVVDTVIDSSATLSTLGTLIKLIWLNRPQMILEKFRIVCHDVIKIVRHILNLEKSPNHQNKVLSTNNIGLSIPIKWHTTPTRQVSKK